VFSSTHFTYQCDLVKIIEFDTSAMENTPIYTPPIKCNSYLAVTSYSFKFVVFLYEKKVMNLWSL